MALTTMQPSFSIALPYSGADSMDRIRSAITEAELDDLSISRGSCAEFFVAPAERRFWSPQLSIQVHDADQGSELFGRFSPRPEVWTMVMFIYFMMIFCICAGALFGWSQWFVNETPWGLWAIPFGIIVIVGLHVTSLIGQRLSCDQMTELRERFDRVLAIATQDK